MNKINTSLIELESIKFVQLRECEQLDSVSTSGKIKFCFQNLGNDREDKNRCR